jgi:hypothetical protein
MEKFARVCDITNEGMNEGYCIGDELMYIKHEKDFVQHLKDIKFSDEELTDEELVELAYEEEYYYWTEWEELDDDYYYLEDGTLVEKLN